ncbi:MAG: tetratricopeptide repeat protein [Terriglobales bacterium]|jgi:tetratricopeptide (TPR) repeat protein
MKYLLAIVLLAGVCLAQTSSQDAGPTPIGPTIPKKTKPSAKPAPKPAPADPDSDPGDSGPMLGPDTGPSWHRGIDTTSDPGTPGESSSKSSTANIPPPTGSAEPDVPEAKPWDPHKADKNIEVGDYYFKQGNYRAAESRYREALEWKPGDAIATYKMGEVMEKQGNLTQARQNYEGYLKILPDGPLADKAKKALERIEKEKSSS